MSAYYRAFCLNVFPFKTLIFCFYFKFVLIVMNVTLAVILCVLLFKRHKKNANSNQNSRYLSQRANLIAIWSVFSETTFGVLPYLSIIIKWIFHVNVPVQDSVLMASVSLDGLFTILLYIKIIVIKQNKMVKSISPVTPKH